MKHVKSRIAQGAIVALTNMPENNFETAENQLPSSRGLEIQWNSNGCGTDHSM